ncbi:MAG: hypothetical protein ACK2T2_13900 [Anaerolineales bacterium]
MEGDHAPEWFAADVHVPREGNFTPRALDRYGERLAWSLAVALAALTIFLFWRQGVWIASLIVIFSLCLVAALLISYGNWMERRTEIWITKEGVRYQNPLRQILVKWESIMAVNIYPRGDGWRVIVEGQEANFSFQTLTTLNLGWGRQVETGIVEGESLAADIAGFAGLEPPVEDREGWVRRRKTAPAS